MRPCLDAQTVELLGRSRLMSELFNAGLEVALPLRDRGIDLIAFAELRTKVDQFIACPIQMKAASASSFFVHRKYSRIRNLILAYVWHVGDPARATTYALTYREAVRILCRMGFAKTRSWKNAGYGVTRPSRKLLALLEPYKMTSEKWWRLIMNSSSQFKCASHG